MKVTCLCEVSENIGLNIYYFTSNSTILKSLCTTDEEINDIINRKFSSTSITFPKELDTTGVDEYAQVFEKFALQPPHIDNIVLVKQKDQFLLFGLANSVKTIATKHKELMQNFFLGEAKHELEDYRVCLKN